MNQKNKEALKKLRKQLENSGGGQKYTLLVGNGFNKYQFCHNKQHDPANCDWEAVINSVASSDEVKKHANANPGLQGKIDRILDMPGIHPAERGIFLFNLLEESKFVKSKTIKVVQEIIKEFTITPPPIEKTLKTIV